MLYVRKEREGFDTVKKKARNVGKGGKGEKGRKEGRKQCKSGRNKGRKTIVCVWKKIGVDTMES